MKMRARAELGMGSKKDFKQGKGNATPKKPGKIKLKAKLAKKPLKK